MFKNNIKHYSVGSVLAIIGFILSPLTWWNDMFINLPLAFLFAYACAKIIVLVLPVNLVIFVILMGIGYFLTNVLGFWMMFLGTSKIFKNKQRAKLSLKKNLLFTVMAIFFVLVSIKFELLDLGEARKYMTSFDMNF